MAPPMGPKFTLNSQQLLLKKVPGHGGPGHGGAELFEGLRAQLKPSDQTAEKLLPGNNEMHHIHVWRVHAMALPPNNPMQFDMAATCLRLL